MPSLSVKFIVLSVACVLSMPRYTHLAPFSTVPAALVSMR